MLFWTVESAAATTSLRMPSSCLVKWNRFPDDSSPPSVPTDSRRLGKKEEHPVQDPAIILMTLFALIIAVPVHEFAHARSAVSYGDDTPARDGRLNIFPWTHFEPFGAIFMVITAIFGYGLGWGKPVMVRPENFRHPRIDDVK